MTVTVEEVLAPANVGASASGSISISTTLLATDLVLIVMSKGASGTNTVSIDGSAAPAYSNWQVGTGNRVYVYSKTGITGSHAVSYTTAATSATNQYTVLVIRGLTNRAITANAISDWSTTGTASNTDEGPASQATDVGQLAVFVGSTTAGTVTFPSNPTPSSGWATDRAANSGTGTHCLAHYIPSSSVSVQANLRTTSTVAIGTLMMLVGDVVSIPPLTSTFVGWGNPIF